MECGNERIVGQYVMDSDELLNSTQAAAAMKISRRTLSAICVRGEITYLDLPRGFFFRQSEIDRWLESRTKVRRPISSPEPTDR